MPAMLFPAIPENAIAGMARSYWGIGYINDLRGM